MALDDTLADSIIGVSAGLTIVRQNHQSVVLVPIHSPFAVQTVVLHQYWITIGIASIMLMPYLRRSCGVVAVPWGSSTIRTPSMLWRSQHPNIVHGSYFISWAWDTRLHEFPHKGTIKLFARCFVSYESKRTCFRLRCLKTCMRPYRHLSNFQQEL